MALHRQLAAGRWQTLDLVEQLANVGSEVDRTIRAFEALQHERFERALARALELFDLTASDGRWRGLRLREILRAREEFVRIFYADASSPASVDGLRRYFLAFAFLARRQTMRQVVTADHVLGKASLALGLESDPVPDASRESA